MGDVVIADAGSSTAVGYFEVWQSLIDSSGGNIAAPNPSVPIMGACPRNRGKVGSGSQLVYDPSQGGLSGDGYLLIDRGYTNMGRGFSPSPGTVTNPQYLTSWLIYSTTTGLQKVGQCFFLVLRVESGNYVIRGMAPMTQDHPGPGVWEHSINPPIQVVKGDLCAMMLLKNVVIGGSSVVAIPYDRISSNNPDRVSEGLLERTTYSGTLAPGTSLGTVALYTQQRRRVGFQARGLYTAATKITSVFVGGWYDGSGRLPFVSGTNFVMDTGIAGTQATVLSNLQGSGSTLSFSAVANTTGNLYYRLTTGVNLIPIEKVKLGFSTILPSSMQIQIAYSDDTAATDTMTVAAITNVTTGVQNWKTFVVCPSDQEDTAVGEDLHFHLARKIKWLRLTVVNSAAQQGCLSNFHIFGFNSQIGSSGQYPYSANNIRDRLFVDSPSATMKISTAITANTTTTVAVVGATAAEIGAIQAGQTIYLRQAGGDFFDYIVDSVNVGSSTITVHPPGTSPGTNIQETYAVNDFVDPPAAFYQIRVFTPGSVEIGRSGFLGTHGQYRERMVYMASPGEEG